EKRAVLIEPLSCAIHAALRANVEPNANVLVVGGGTIGILTLLALKEFTQAGRITVVAKHRVQQEWAKGFGATDVVDAKEAINAAHRSSHAMKLKPDYVQSFLLGGVDVAIDAVGSKSSLDLALRTTKAGGRVVAAGIPGQGADLTPLWYRELELVGAYTGGPETPPGGGETSERLALRHS